MNLDVMKTPPIRVLLLDDHPFVLDGLAGHLESEGIDVCGRFTKVDDALPALSELKPDVCIVDIKIGGVYSFDFVRQARELLPDTRYIFITGYDDDLLIEQAFAVGALGYVLKSEPSQVLSEAVCAASQGERFVSPALVARDPELARDDARPVTRLSVLTRREREVLKLVSAGKSAKEISKILKISTWTVTNHKANIMAKLDIHNQVGLARFALRAGLATL